MIFELYNCTLPPEAAREEAAFREASADLFLVFFILCFPSRGILTSATSPNPLVNLGELETKESDRNQQQ